MNVDPATLTPGKYRLWILLLAALLFFPGLGNIPFTDRDEGEYTTVAGEMIDRSDYIIPHVNGRAYYEKPALFFWLTALSFRALGRNETAGRLPSAMCGLVLVAMIGWFGRRQGGEWLGTVSALMAATTFLIVLMSRVVLVDMLLTVWTTAALMLFYTGYRNPGPGERWYFYGGWAALAAAFLTKGPVGVAAPLTALIPLALFDRQLLATLKRVRIPEGLIIFFLLAGPWYVLAFMRDGKDFWEGFFISQNVRRYTEVLLGHGGGIWYYIPVLLFMAWPWFIFALPALWRGIKGNPRAKRENDSLAELDLFLTLWVIGGWLLFSMSATKLPHYILPVVPAVVLAAGRWWQERLGGARVRPREEKILWPLVGLIGFLLGAVLLVGTFFLPLALDLARKGVRYDSFEYTLPPWNPDLGLGPPIVGAVLLISLAVALVYRYKGRIGRSLAALIAAAALLTIGLTHVAAPPVLDYLQTPGREIAFEVKAMMGPDDRLATYGLYKPTLWFYTGRHIHRFRTDQKDEFHAWLQDDKKSYVISRLVLRKDLEATSGFTVLSVKGGYLLGVNHKGEGDKASP